MASVTLTSPTIARIDHLTDDEVKLLQMQLTYTDKKVSYEVNKFKHARWYVEKHGYDAWKDELDRKRAEEKKCLLLQDFDGFYTYSGLCEKVSRILGVQPQNSIAYPEYGTIGWANKPPFERHLYQVNAQGALQEARHAGVEIGTGLGKSYIIRFLTKEIGLRTVIMAPTESIARQLYRDCVQAFGLKHVGFYGAGTKKIKTVTICIAASLAKVKQGSDDWDELARAEVFVADESHLCPAKTLKEVCFGLMAKAPYRFFFSGTQIRNDGLDLLLDAITGPIVYEMSVREGIEGGYLSALEFYMLRIHSNVATDETDPNELTRAHLYYNDAVNRIVAMFINNFVGVLKKRVLVLIEELEQFSRLYPYLQHACKFAHGGVTAENKDLVPKPFHDSDPDKFVTEFNNEEYPILIGTSCIATGTDVKANEVTVYLRGGQSEIEVSQGAIGRSTRLHTFKDGRKKTSCIVLDVDIVNEKTLHRHAAAREAIYNRTYGPVKEFACA